VRRRQWLATLVLVLLVSRPASAALLDAFDDLSGWTVLTSPGVSAALVADEGRGGSPAMRIDFDFHGPGGYVIARKAFQLALPENYAFTFQLRADAPPNTLEFKVVDPTGENVWWSNQRDFSFPRDWQQITVRKSRLRFAWGPANGASATHVAQIELAISAGTGGKGSIWVDDLALEAREPDGQPPPRPTMTASSAIPDHDAARALDGDPETSWRSAAEPPEQWLILDLGKRREFGGIVVDWDPQDFATVYRVETSEDGVSWTASSASTTSEGGRDYFYMPDMESRYIRLLLSESNRGAGYGIREITVQPPSFAGSLNDFFASLAADAPPGAYPKYFLGRQTYWTVVGVDGDDKEALINQEGAVEVDKGAFSLEPFLYADGALVTWADVQTSQELADGDLPIPTVTWRNGRFTLRTTAFADGPPGSSALYVRYDIENATDAPADVVLFVTMRPFQVLPPWQSLNMVGGVTPIRTIDFTRRTVTVDGERTVVALTRPDDFGATTFAQGLVRNFLQHGHVPIEQRVSDPFGHASGALEYRLRLDPGSRGQVHVAAPFHDPRAAAGRLRGESAAAIEAHRVASAHDWEALVGRVELLLPPAAANLVRTWKSTLAYILINRDGPAIQPGSRTYARSWIRDGAFTATALLQMGLREPARDFIAWFARYQLPDGRIPCCVDQRGADMTPEHDSNGEFIFAVAEYYRYTRDVGFLQAMWPAMVRAVESIAALRAQQTTDEFKQPEKRAFYGLLPESISHEGYSARPVHSYWDDFFALRGLKDAASMALVVGDDERAASIATLRDAFRTDLYASIAATMARHRIDYIPASVELGDFDPSSTAIAVSPGGELANLPQEALQRTFERYYEHAQAYLRGTELGQAYTPYELRNVEVLVRMRQRARAYEILEWMMADQRPPAWNEWQEIVWRNPAAPNFIGDMPHTWVGSGFIHSLRSMLAYEREEDRALVLAAGVPAAWLASEAGVGVKRLPTHYGVLSYTLRSEGADAIRVRLSGDVSVPPGGIVIEPPLPRPLKVVTVNGKTVQSFDADAATVTEFPADVVLEY
jgi:hypothetical protein